MSGSILVLNAGSSSLKFSLYGVEGSDVRDRARGLLERVGDGARLVARNATGAILSQRTWTDVSALTPGHEVDHVFDLLGAVSGADAIGAVGHRVVHGGTRFTEPVCIDERILAELDALTPLAPLHQPHDLAPIRRIAQCYPALPQVACFDTAFHSGAPELERMFAIPASIADRGVRRYGFHGLSYEYIASRLGEIDPDLARGRAIVAHLGNGASMCAMYAGRSVATTMGFTALDGLMMGTRCGSLDPGVILYLIDELRMDARAIERVLYRESGLLGVSGISADMRELLASEAPRARSAVELFCYRIVRELGGLAAALGGVDGIVFTGGIGEHAAPVRERVLSKATWLGFDLDAQANSRDALRITTTASRPAYVLATNEERVIAQHTRAVVMA